MKYLTETDYIAEQVRQGISDIDLSSDFTPEEAEDFLLATFSKPLTKKEAMQRTKEGKPILDLDQLTHGR